MTYRIVIISACIFLASCVGQNYSPTKIEYNSLSSQIYLCGRDSMERYIYSISIRIDDSLAFIYPKDDDTTKRRLVNMNDYFGNDFSLKVIGANVSFSIFAGIKKDSRPFDSANELILVHPDSIYTFDCVGS